MFSNSTGIKAPFGRKDLLKTNMPSRCSMEIVSVLIFDGEDRILLENFQNRGLWLPTEQKQESSTLLSAVQRIVDTVSVEMNC